MNGKCTLTIGIALGLCGCASDLEPPASTAPPEVAMPAPQFAQPVFRKQPASPVPAQRGTAEIVEKSGVSKVSYTVLSTDCPMNNTGWWMDGADARIILKGQDFAIEFWGFPAMTGTLDANGTGDLEGDTVIMKYGAVLQCSVTGHAAAVAGQMSGTVTEVLTGGLACQTVGRFSFALPQ